MLLTFFAILTGSLIGRIRGGRRAGVSNAELHATPLLVVAISTMLVQTVLNPIFPFLWSFVGVVTLIAFAYKNRHLTGMTVFLIGAALNIIPLLLNGATPVSELALLSVGDVDPFGFPEINGARESSATATRLTFLGDAIPVPIFGAVVSIGDLILLVGLGDVFTNLFLNARSRELELDDAGVSFAAHADDSSTSDSATTDSASAGKVSILSPLEAGNRSSAHRAPRRKAAPLSHEPAHAGLSNDVTEDEAPSQDSGDHVPAHAAEPIALEHRDEPLIIDLNDLIEPGKQAHEEEAKPAVNSAITAVTAAALSTAGASAIAITPSAALAPVVEEEPEVIDLTDPNDPRPIIDLTKSPTDAQMTEFLRRRKSADRRQVRVPVRPPGQRRGRAPARISSNEQVEVVETVR